MPLDYGFLRLKNNEEKFVTLRGIEPRFNP